MQYCDALIVGAGPAGSTLAWRLTQAGYNVHIVDRATFPRETPCAGWITPQVVESLELSLLDYGESHTLQPVSAFVTGIIGREPLFTGYREPVGYGVIRSEFDHYLLERSGARYHLSQAVECIRRHQGLWEINERFRTPLLIGAGGRFCPVARHLGTDRGCPERAVSGEVMEWRLDAWQKANCPSRGKAAELYFYPDLKGYGWIFRKHDYLNIGLRRDDAHEPNAHFENFVHWLQETRRVPFDLSPNRREDAYLTHTSSNQTIAAEGILLIGDAADIAPAQSDEGIRTAVESALIAAHAIGNAPGDYSETNLRGYEYRLRSHFGRRSLGKRIHSDTPIASALRRRMGTWLLEHPTFVEKILLNRWLLRRHESPWLTPKTASRVQFSSTNSPQIDPTD
ncbi:MAG: NAD(P)/FAD-dependent oxidoreductase [Pseudomonadota bacterium]|nr:NAD(P)/FAD-dependent oxidoreductase [Pseudomonadota bacterium]